MFGFFRLHARQAAVASDVRVGTASIVEG